MMAMMAIYAHQHPSLSIHRDAHCLPQAAQTPGHSLRGFEKLPGTMGTARVHWAIAAALFLALLGLPSLLA